MDILSSFWNFFFETLLAEFIVVVVGVLFAFFIQNRWVKWRYGGWKVIVQDDKEQFLVREISPTKAKQILDEPAELSVFIKGVISPYGFLNCDLLTRGKDVGLFIQDDQNRCFYINLDKNPPPDQKRKLPSAL